MTTTSMLPDVGIELREGYAQVGDVNLHYVEAGDGPLIVLLHGFLFQHHAEFAADVDAFLAS